MPAIHRDFNYPYLPDFIYWDTSFLAGLYLTFLRTYQQYNTDCSSFARRVFASNTIPVTSDLALNESVHLLIQNELRREVERHNQQNRTHLSINQYRQRNPTVIQNFLTDVNKVRQLIEAVCMIFCPQPDVTDLAFDVINNYYLRPTDAYHIGSAQSYGITAFAAIDRDFLRVDGIEVFTCLSP